MAGLNILVTGKPGEGKTSLVERLIERLRGSLRLAGFTTTEVQQPLTCRLSGSLIVPFLSPA